MRPIAFALKSEAAACPEPLMPMNDLCLQMMIAGLHMIFVHTPLTHLLTLLQCTMRLRRRCCRRHATAVAAAAAHLGVGIDFQHSYHKFLETISSTIVVLVVTLTRSLHGSFGVNASLCANCHSAQHVHVRHHAWHLAGRYSHSDEKVTITRFSRILAL